MSARPATVTRASADSRRPIFLVESDSAMGRGIDGEGVQIKVTYRGSAGGRADLIPQANIQGQIRGHADVVLHELRQVPVARGVDDSEKVILQRRLRNTKQRIGQPVSCVIAAETQLTRGRCLLEKISLLPPEVGAELE